MHPNPVYRRSPTALNLAFARDRAFDTLALNGAEGPLLSHVPFEIDAGGGTLRLHMVRSNPILSQLVTPQPAVLSVLGPDGYVSPDWYGLPDQVPTWNYVAVHLRGTLRKLDTEELRPVLDGLSAQMEPRLAGKRPWTTAKMTPEVLERMMRQIVPCAMDITRIDGTWKLSQNKTADARIGAAEAIEAGGQGQALAELAALMRDPPDPV